MDSVMKSEMRMWQLKQSMGEEIVAASVYRQRALQAEECGDTKSAALWRDIAKDEDDHYRQFGGRLSEITAEGIAPIEAIAQIGTY